MVLFNTFNHLLKYYVKILQNLLPRGLRVITNLRGRRPRLTQGCSAKRRRRTNLRGKGFDVGAI